MHVLAKVKFGNCEGMNIETSLSISIWPRTICVAKKEPCPEANRCPLFEYTFYVNTQKNLNRCTCSALLLPGNKCSTPRKCSIIILPSCTAWKGLFPSTNSTEMVIFSVSKISLFKLRSATARRNTSSSFRADSSKMAPVDKEGSRKEKRKLLFSIRGLFEWKKRQKCGNTEARASEVSSHTKVSSQAQPSTPSEMV